MLQKQGCQPIVVVPLLDRVVLGRKGEVFLSIGNQKLFEYYNKKWRKAIRVRGVF